MSGFSSVTGLETIVYADNASFDGTQRGGALSANGEFWIGSSAAPNVKKGFLTSVGNSVAITYDEPNINLEVIQSDTFTWKSVTSSSPTNPIQIVTNTAYVCNGVSLVTFILPLSPNFGDEFIVLSNTATFEITENGSQIIQLGSAQSTAGSGNIASNTSGDMIRVVYIGSNLFMVIQAQGTITLT